MKTRIQWLLLAVAAVVAIILWQIRGGVFHEGQIVDAPITLVPKDRTELSCSYPSAVGPYRCEFEAPDKAWAEIPPREQRLTPYMTADQILYLLPGLFEVPEVQERAADKERRTQRFAAHCKLRLIKRLERVGTRWGRRNGWGTAGPAWVGEPLSCVIEETD